MIGCRVQYVLKPIEKILKSNLLTKKLADKPRKVITEVFKKLGLDIKCTAKKIDFQSTKVTGNPPGAYFKDDKNAKNTFVPSITLGNIKNAAFQPVKGKLRSPRDLIKKVIKMIKQGLNLEALQITAEAKNVCGPPDFATRASKCTAAIAADLFG